MRRILLMDVLHGCFELLPSFFRLVLCHVHAAPHIGGAEDLHTSSQRLQTIYARK